MGGAPRGIRVSGVTPDQRRRLWRDAERAAHDVEAAGVLNEQQPGYSDENAEQ